MYRHYKDHRQVDEDVLIEEDRPDDRNLHEPWDLPDAKDDSVVEGSLVRTQYLQSEVVSESGTEGHDHDADNDLVGTITESEESEQ